MENVKQGTLHTFVHSVTQKSAAIYTDNMSAYKRLPNHKFVSHGAGQYVDGDVPTQGIESFLAMLKRANKGTFRKFSTKHLH